MKKKTVPVLGEREFRSFGVADIRADADSSVIEGHAAVFGQATRIGNWFTEIIERGAFDNCDFSDVLFTTNHGLERIPLARSRRNNANSTLQLSVDEIGLKVRASLDTENNADAKTLYSAVGRGDIDGMSFIMVVAEERWEGLDTELPTRHVLSIRKVWDVSAVNFPAYTGTDIDARGAAAVETAARALENARTTLENEKRCAALELERLKTQTLML